MPAERDIAASSSVTRLDVNLGVRLSTKMRRNDTCRCFLLLHVALSPMFQSPVEGAVGSGHCNATDLTWDLNRGAVGIPETCSELNLVDEQIVSVGAKPYRVTLSSIPPVVHDR